MTEEDPGHALRTLELRAGTVWLRADGIVYFRNKLGVRHSVADVQLHFAAYLDLAGSVRRPLLVDARGEFLAEPGARDAYGKPPDPGPTAMAMLIDSKYGRTFGNLALAFRRLPTRLFTEEEAALAWLRKFIPQRR